MKRNEPEEDDVQDTALPKMKKRDFTIKELREFDGTKGDGRILIAVNGKVFDVTKGKHFYGPGKTCSLCWVYNFTKFLTYNQLIRRWCILYVWWA